MIRRSESSVVQRENRGGQWVYVKRYLNQHEWWNAECGGVKKEFEILSEAAQLRSRPRYLGLMIPLSCDPKKAEIVLAAVEGTPCDTILGPSYAKYSPRTRLTVAWLCGRWLRWFQQNIRYGDIQQPKKEIIHHFGEYCKTRIERSRYFQRQSPCRRAKVVDLVQSLIALTPPDQLRMVWLHGDYAPGNILWDGHKITPIDFGMLHPGIALLDATYFVHRLQMQRVYRPWLRLPVAALTKAFWRGYGESFDRSSPLFTACMVKHCLCRLLTYELRQGSTPTQRVHSAWIRCIVQFMLMWLVHHGERHVKPSSTLSQPIYSDGNDGPYR